MIKTSSTYPHKNSGVENEVDREKEQKCNQMTELD